MNQAVSIATNWRSLTLAATAALVIGLAARGGPFDVVVALMLVTPSMLAWLLLADSPKRGVKIAAVLLVVFTVLYGWSQLLPGVIAPPLAEWGIACAVIGGAIVGVAFRHRRNRGSQSEELLFYPGQSTRTRPRPIVAGAIATFPIALAMCCVPATWVLRDASSAGLLEVHADEQEALPLPARVRLVHAHCVGGGSHFLCTTVLTVAATDGASRDMLVERLAQHYRTRDWPLERSEYRYYGCRPVQGILTWHHHCMSLHFDPNTENLVDRPEIPNTVNVYVG